MFHAAATPPKLFTLILVSGLSILSLNMFLPSLDSIAAEFGVDYALVNLSIAAYAGMTAVLQLIMGPMSDRFGRRPVILSGLVIFCAASLGCALSKDIATFLTFRLLQGAVVTGVAVSMAVIRDSAEPRRVASLAGYVAMAWACAPMLGPIIGGGLNDLFGWRANFWLFLGLGLAIFALCWIDLGETNKNRANTMGQQFRSYPALLSSKRFWGYLSCSAFCTGAYYAFLTGAPLIAIQILNQPAAYVGVYLGSITGGFLFGSFLSGRFAERFALTTMMIVGRSIACIGLSIGIVLLLTGVVHVLSIFGACIFLGIGNGMTLPSCNAGVVSVRPDLAGSASGLSGSSAVAVGALSSAFTGAVLSAFTAPATMLAIMLAFAMLGLLAALYVRWLESPRQC